MEHDTGSKGRDGYSGVDRPSDYAAARRFGFRALRFPDAVEREYRRVRAPLMRRRLLSVGAAGLAAIGLWFAIDWFTTRYFQFPAAWIILGAWMAPLLAILLLMNLPGRRNRPVDRWLLFAVDVLLGLALVVLELLMEARGQSGWLSPYIALVVTLSAIYAGGMMTWRALFAGLIITLAYGLGHAAFVHHPFVLAHTLFFLCATVAIGSSACWHLEYADREQFLQGRLMEEMAERDSLTGLLNHGAFMSHGQRAWKQAAREGKPLGLLIADIDHFKQYNDHYGHPAGDECIRRIATVLSAAAQRGLDAAARLGGEELAVLWYDIPADQVARKAALIRSGVHELDVEHAPSEVASRVTVSIGTVAVVPSGSSGFRAALSRADRALYAAKAGGRDRIVSG